jgi:hypothetical protein
LADFVELRPQLLDAAELGGDLRQRACRVLVEPADAALTRFDLAADRARPRLGLLAERAQLSLRRGAIVEHLAEPLHQGEFERRLGHLRPRDPKGSCGLALEGAEGAHEGVRSGLPTLALGAQRRLVGVARAGRTLEVAPGGALPFKGLLDGVFALFS